MSEEIDMIDSTKENINWIKPIEGHEDYLITNNGMVWSRKTNRWMKSGKTHEGHLQIHLDDNYHLVHRLVFETFYRRLLPNEVVHHLNQEKNCNLVTNLVAWDDFRHRQFHHKGKKKGPHSQEHKKKIGLKSKGRKHSEETKEKIRQARLGTKRSEETKKKLSEKGKEFYLLHPQRKNQNRKRMKQNPVQKDLLTGRFISINDQ